MTYPHLNEAALGFRIVAEEIIITVMLE